MGKKKRGHPDVEEILSRPWCYYCQLFLYLLPPPGANLSGPQVSETSRI